MKFIVLIAVFVLNTFASEIFGAPKLKIYTDSNGAKESVLSENPRCPPEF